MTLYKVSIYIILPRTMYIEAPDTTEATRIANEKYPDNHRILVTSICKTKDIIKYDR